MSHSRSNKKCKNVVLIITSDKGVTTNEVAECLGIDTKEKAVRVLITDLKGKNLEKAVRQYMRNNGITVSRGDEVIFMENRT